ncbi:hypothetical protein K2173_019368 [Erythroxylum novogranatense]|uniref:Zinc-ribbon 15 domain-containing protein n=1 Tax=Erythroxylum novogranatense TaxID=1862640 RepID=A0AAV8UDW8_9ROSI|nr:hypothetical protein K2173_019368 [Erythroxylum novogranatense]
MADLVEYDKVVKAFFIIVWKRHAKEPALYCNNCNFLFPESVSLIPLPPPPASEISDILRCRLCDRLVDPEFRFSPFCGSSL